MEQVELNEYEEQDLLGFLEESPGHFVPIHKMPKLNTEKPSSSQNKLANFVSPTTILKFQDKTIRVGTKDTNNVILYKHPDNLSPCKQIVIDKKQRKTLVLTKDKHSGDSFIVIKDKLVPIKKVHIDKNMCVNTSMRTLGNNKNVSDTDFNTEVFKNKNTPNKVFKSKCETNTDAFKSSTDRSKSIAIADTDLNRSNTGVFKNSTEADLKCSNVDVGESATGAGFNSTNTEKDFNSKNVDVRITDVKVDCDLIKRGVKCKNGLKRKSTANDNINEKAVLRNLRKATSVRKSSIRKHESGLLEIIRDLTNEMSYLKRVLVITRRKLKRLQGKTNNTRKSDLNNAARVETKVAVNNHDVKLTTKESKVGLVANNCDVKLTTEESKVGLVANNCDVKLPTKESKVGLVANNCDVKLTTKKNKVGLVAKETVNNCNVKMTSNDGLLANNCNINLLPKKTINNCKVDLLAKETVNNADVNLTVGNCDVVVEETPNVMIDFYDTPKILYQDINMGVQLDVPRVIAVHNGHGIETFNGDVNFESRVTMWFCYKMCDKQDEDGDFPIHIAASKNDVKGVTRQCHALKMRNLPVDLENFEGQTPLQLAVINKVSTSIVQTLKNFNADFSFKDVTGNTIFHLAAKNNYLKELHKANLLDGIDPKIINAYNYDGQTALMIAVKNKNKDDAKVLIDLNADLNLQDKTNGKTALFHAVESNSLDLVDLLMANGAETGRKNFSGHRLQDTIGELDVSPSLKKLFSDMEVANLEMKKRASRPVMPMPPFTFVAKKMKI